MLTLLTAMTLYVVPLEKQDTAAKVGDERVLSLAFSPDSRQVLVGRTGQLETWDVSRRAKMATASFPNQDVTCVGFMADHYVVGTVQSSTADKVGGKGKVLLLDKDLFTRNSKPGHHIFAKEGTSLYTADGEQAGDGSVLDDKGKAIIAQLPGFVCGLCTNGKLLAVGTTGRVVKLIKPHGRDSVTLDVEFRGTNNSLAFVGDNIALLGKNSSLFICSTDGKVIDNYPTQGTCLAAAENLVVVGTRDGALEGYPLKGKNGIAFRKLAAHTGPVYAIAISPDGKWLASGGLDGKVVFTRIPSR